LLVLAGQLGLDASVRLRDEAEVLAAQARDVDLDWGETQTVTASSLQVLLALGVTLSKRGRALRVTADNPGIRHLLELSGLSACFPRSELIT
jgi:ABC-type transporter Mla MlaB component